MNDKLRYIAVVAVLTGFACAPASSAYGALSGPPPSFIVLARDGKHMLVMLSRVPLADDEGNVCMLPNGEQVKLRDRFSSSGLYQVASTTPIWKVDWYGEKGLVQLSDDGRYLVRVNRFGGGGLGEQPRSYCGLKFYDAGIELASYDVGELVDYLSLMRFTTDFDYHYLWYDDIGEVHNELFHLKTSCREEYTFDVTTGAIVAESRFWRRVCHWTIAVLLVIGALVTWLLCRRWRSRRTRIGKAPVPDAIDATPTQEGGRFQYSLRSLMIFVTAIAVLCSICRTWPHVGVFVSGLSLAMFLTGLLLRGRRRSARRRRTLAARAGRALFWVVTLASWCVAYALSFAPALALVGYCGGQHDVRMVLAQTLYAPVYCLLMHTRLAAWQPVELYFHAFGAHL